MIVMYKIAVLGDKDSVLAFKALGLEVVIAYDKDEARNRLDGLAKEGFGVIFITEQLASLIPETINRYNDKIIPAVILIPSNQGTLGIGMDSINRNVEKAVGSNIL